LRGGAPLDHRGGPALRRVARRGPARDPGGRRAGAPRGEGRGAAHARRPLVGPPARDRRVRAILCARRAHARTDAGRKRMSMRKVRAIVFAVALLALLLVIFAGPGTKYGWWDYRVGLTLLQFGAYVALAA